VSEPRLKPQLPLGGANPRVETFAGLTITERADVALASIACRRDRGAEFNSAAEALFGFALPGPGRIAASTPYAAIWTGPEQWFVEAPMATHEDIARMLKDKLGDAASVTELTDGWARFEVEGARLAGVFERLCEVDLRLMQAGQARHTVIEHLGCLVMCRVALTAITVLGPRSAARSLRHAMAAAAGSVGYGTAGG